jgi:uncharacterized membrane protein YdjX (TVP38/TMEM64 family)
LYRRIPLEFYALQRMNVIRYALVSAIFILSFCGLLLLLNRMPRLKEEEISCMKMPKTLDDARQIGLVLSRYRTEYYWEVLSSITVLYIFLQAFMIPGSVFFSVLLGYLFPFRVALFIVCLCSASGASGCFLISRLVGKSVLNKWLPDQIKYFQSMTREYNHIMCIFIFFLRILPIIPNWSVNIVAPLVDVPLGHFFVGTFFGVIPLSLLAIQTGTTLQDLTVASHSAANSFYTLAFFTIIALIPFIFRKRLRQLVS